MSSQSPWSGQVAHNARSLLTQTATYNLMATLEVRPLEFRWHGRGGQGVVTASRLLAEAALLSGFYVQSLPDFGAERSGAPLVVYTRIGRNPFWDRGHVNQPDVVVVLDPSLLGKVGVIEGVRDRAVVVVNAHASPQNLKQLFPGTHHTLCTIDGTAIALQLLGRNLPNVPVLGALLRVVPIVDLEQAKQALRERFQVRFPESVVEGNLRALMRGFEEASVEGDS